MNKNQMKKYIFVTQEYTYYELGDFSNKWQN